MNLLQQKKKVASNVAQYTPPTVVQLGGATVQQGERNPIETHRNTTTAAKNSHDAVVVVVDNEKIEELARKAGVHLSVIQDTIKKGIAFEEIEKLVNYARSQRSFQNLGGYILTGKGFDQDGKCKFQATSADVVKTKDQLDREWRENEPKRIETAIKKQFQERQALEAQRAQTRQAFEQQGMAALQWFQSEITESQRAEIMDTLNTSLIVKHDIQRGHFGPSAIARLITLKKQHAQPVESDNVIQLRKAA